MTETSTQRAAIEGDRRERVVHIDGGPIVVRPVRVGDLPEFLRRGEGLFKAVFNEQSEADWVELIVAHLHDATGWVALGSGVPRERLEKLPADDAFALTQAVVEVNLDFFAGRVARAVNVLVARLATALSATSAPGSTTPAPGSSPAATAEPTSPGTH